MLNKLNIVAATAYLAGWLYEVVGPNVKYLGYMDWHYLLVFAASTIVAVGWVTTAVRKA